LNRAIKKYWAAQMVHPTEMKLESPTPAGKTLVTSSVFLHTVNTVYHLRISLCYNALKLYYKTGAVYAIWFHNKSSEENYHHPGFDNINTCCILAGTKF
jgi:hypothetical protein